NFPITYPSKLAVRPDGKIAVGGFGDLLVLTSAGAPDTTFSGDGRAQAAYAVYRLTSSDLIAQPDNKIVVTGDASVSTGTSGSIESRDFALARFNTDGAL